MHDSGGFFPNIKQNKFLHILQQLVTNAVVKYFSHLLYASLQENGGVGRVQLCSITPRIFKACKMLPFD